MLYITSERIIDEARSSLFEHTTSEVPHHEIEDVSSKISGISGVLFRYGTLTIKTAKGSVFIIMERIQQPARVQELINQLRS